MSPPLPTTSSPPLPAAHRCCALDAEGQETKVHLAVAGEGFTATGLMVTHRHFLEVYRYQGWGGQEALPLFQQGQTFQPAAIELKQVGACRQWENFYRCPMESEVPGVAHRQLWVLRHTAHSCHVHVSTRPPCRARPRRRRASPSVT